MGEGLNSHPFRSKSTKISTRFRDVEAKEAAKLLWNHLLFPTLPGEERKREGETAPDVSWQPGRIPHQNK